jgi:teichuronic acid biosynthesis glycosyltransferase TuaC
MVIRALIVTNMWPTPARPALGSFVADQVAALERTGEVELDVFAFGGGAGDPRAYARAGARLAGTRRAAPRRDIVHAHFGLSAWPARAARGAVHAVTLHGTDIVHPRSRALTLAALPFTELVATVSQPLAALVPGWATHRRPPVILPTGVDLHRFVPIDRAEARRALGLRTGGRYLLFAADPARPEKRVDRARELVVPGTELLTLGAAAPAEVPLWVNAADAVIVTSDRESFGLAALEALACEVPVLSTPVGVAPARLRELPGTLCAPVDAPSWRTALETLPHRLSGARARVAEDSSDACAARVIAAWRTALATH